MKNLKIRMKLILSFMLVLLFTVAVGVVGIFSITSLSDNTALLNDRANISILVGRMSENIQQQRAAYRGAGLYYVMENDESTTSNLNDLETLDAEYQASLEQLGTMLVTEEGQRLYGVIQDAYPPYVQARDVFLETLLNPDTSNELMMEDMLLILPPLDVLIAASNDITNFMDEMTTQQAETAASQAVSTTVMLIVILVVVAAVAVVLSLYISTLISKPLALMQGVLVQVGSTGNMNFTPDQIEPLRREAKYKDEIGQSIAAFEKTMERLLYVSARLKEVADGDLTADIELLTPQDTMGSALKAMDENLNNMFSEINSVAQQVATASTEIAQGAQSLAQGSTEQASTVQEISASVNEITEQAEVSVQTANGAAQDSQGIRRIAQDGNEKMGRLSEAVQEMSDASQSIGNVIKVIDDIAFQTNILALNAAVEAARAGEHGKGFAVVADEVRNLAGKSAEAAKETSALISANIEKSTMGLNISNETAEALQKIVAGVEKTTESLNTISGQSQGAKAATEQVTMAVEQVAQVVQQNSATSEQSAAASQEMSSQAQVLQHLVTRFRLKERSQMAAPRSLPPAAPRGAAGQVTGPADSIIF